MKKAGKEYEKNNRLRQRLCPQEKKNPPSAANNVQNVPDMTKKENKGQKNEHPKMTVGHMILYQDEDEDDDNNNNGGERMISKRAAQCVCVKDRMRS